MLCLGKVNTTYEFYALLTIYGIFWKILSSKKWKLRFTIIIFIIIVGRKGRLICSFRISSCKCTFETCSMFLSFIFASSFRNMYFRLIFNAIFCGMCLQRIPWIKKKDGILRNYQWISLSGALIKQETNQCLTINLSKWQVKKRDWMPSNVLNIQLKTKLFRIHPFHSEKRPEIQCNVIQDVIIRHPAITWLAILQLWD